MGPWCKLQRRAGFKWEALGKCPSNRNLKRTVYSDWEGIFLSLPLMLLSRKKYKEKTAANSLSVWTLCLYMLCVYQLLIVRVHLTSHQCHFLVSKLFPMSNHELEISWKMFIYLLMECHLNSTQDLCFTFWPKSGWKLISHDNNDHGKGLMDDIAGTVKNLVFKR